MRGDILHNKPADVSFLSRGKFISGAAKSVVWFSPSRPTGDGRFAHIDGRKPLAAIVSHVFNDALVNLAVFDRNGQPHGRTSVPLVLVEEGEAKPEHDYFCSWMPYQVGQPGKHAKPE